jgi:hypothetical protein
MTITCTKDWVMTYDGLNQRKYEAGKTYTAGSAVEQITFGLLISRGAAVESAGDVGATTTKTIKAKERK